MSDLVICKLSDASAPVEGGKDIILLCEKVTKGIIEIWFNFLFLNLFNFCLNWCVSDDIQIRFFEEKDGECNWEGYADFQPSDVHKQVAIYFRTPRYQTTQVNLLIKLKIYNCNYTWANAYFYTLVTNFNFFFETKS